MAGELSYRTRLSAGAAGLTLMSLALAAASWISIRNLSARLETTSGVAARQLELAGDLKSRFEKLSADARAAQVALVIGMLENGSSKEGQCSGRHSAEMVNQHRGRAEATAGELSARLNQALAGTGDAARQAARVADESAAEAEELAQASESLEECVTMLARMIKATEGQGRHRPEGSGR